MNTAVIPRRHGMKSLTETIMDTLNRNLQSIWDGDVETYRATTADDVSFFEW
jgi:hypothetical protein